MDGVLLIFVWTDILGRNYLYSYMYSYRDTRTSMTARQGTLNAKADCLVRCQRHETPCSQYDMIRYTQSYLMLYKNAYHQYYS